MMTVIYIFVCEFCTAFTDVQHMQNKQRKYKMSNAHSIHHYSNKMYAHWAKRV